MTTFRWNFEEDLSQAAALGFTAIGLWRQKLADYGEQAGQALLAAMGLSVSNVCWAGGFIGSDGRSLAESIADATDAIRLTAALHADCLVVYSGPRGGHTNTHAHRLFRDSLRELLPAARRFGVTLAIKAVHAHCAVDCGIVTRLSDAVDLIRSFDDPCVKLAFDTYQMGWDLDVPDRLAELANDIAIVHLADGHPPTHGEMHCCPLGQGDVPVEAMLAALERGGYNGYFDLKLVGAANDPAGYRDLLVHSQQSAADMLSALPSGSQR
ncbi:MAG TPA: sugar phosphate isomerase/epimerase family protein [Pirellulales bacterium]|nr:sugar phosphate isomerase/epimerase family protein [Pirellulales bacterium]